MKRDSRREGYVSRSRLGDLLMVAFLLLAAAFSFWRSSAYAAVGDEDREFLGGGMMSVTLVAICLLGVLNRFRGQS
jgi:hypothetical protein